MGWLLGVRNPRRSVCGSCLVSWWEGTPPLVCYKPPSLLPHLPPSLPLPPSQPPSHSPILELDARIWCRMGDT